MPMRSDMVIPATKVRSEFTRILPLIRDNQYYTLTYKGFPKVAIVDLKYLEKLERWYKFESVFQAGGEDFAQYLKSIGKDINTISEKEANEIIWKLAGIS